MISQPSHALIFSLFLPPPPTILRLCLKHNHQPQPTSQPPQHPTPNPPCTERDPHEPVAAQVLRPLRGRLWLLLDGRRRRVHEAEAPLEGAPEENTDKATRSDSETAIGIIRNNAFQNREAQEPLPRAAISHRMLFVSQSGS